MVDARRRRDRRARRAHRDLLGRDVVLADRVIVGVAAVAGIPLVGPGHACPWSAACSRSASCSAVAADRHRLGVDQRAAQVERERDRAGLVIAARERRRVVQGHGRRAQRDGGRARRRRDRRARCADHDLLGRGVVLAGRAVVGVAAVAGIPLVGPGHGTRRRQRVAGRRRVGAVAVDRHRLGVHQRAAQVERERDRAGLVIAARERRGVLQGHRRRAQRERWSRSASS